MDEEDFITDLGWNKKNSTFDDETVVSSDVIDSGVEATASTSEPINSSQSEATEGNIPAVQSKACRPVKGRRGRPRLYCTVLKPTREKSKRKRRCPQFMNYHKELPRSERNRWSHEDQDKLHEALEEFGSYNYKAIRTKLPGKTELDVKRQIQLWKNLATSSLQNKLVPDKKHRGSAMVNCCAKLDDWFEHFEWLASFSSSKSFALAHVFSLISEYGKFPSPEECNGVDFRAMYHYLHCILNGEPYTGVNPETAYEINLNISHMLSMIKDYNYVTDLQPHLYNLTNPPTACLRTYGRQPCTSTQLKAEAIMNLPHLNPLRIPPHMLIKPVTDNCYSDDDMDARD